MPIATNPAALPLPPSPPPPPTDCAKSVLASLSLLDALPISVSATIPPAPPPPALPPMAAIRPPASPPLPPPPPIDWAN
jgi:hypothetical protein